MSELISGVSLKDLNPIPDERGYLMEILRSDWDEYDQFGQVYVTTVYPGVVKAWHMHKKQSDHFTCIKGNIKLALYDDRKNSTTQGQINEFYIGEKNHKLVKIPPHIYHGFKGIGETEAIIINIPTHLYNYENPDEYRLPPDTDQINYNWILDPSKKHG